MMENNQPDDLAAIHEVSFRYAAGVDRRDRGLFLSAFHADATLRVFRTDPRGYEVIGRRMGHEEIGIIPSLMSRYDKTFHFIGNHLCSIRGDDAEGEVYCVAHHLSQGIHGGTDFVMFIRYQDRYWRDSACEWRIADRLVQVDWAEVHATLEAPAGSPSLFQRVDKFTSE
jgi:hypothetical protein